MVAFANILVGGVFHAAVLFLVAAGLQLVFGVQKIVNLACGSFYALGAYFGITFVTLAFKAGMPNWMLLPLLLVAGLLMAAIGPPIERLLRTVNVRSVYAVVFTLGTLLGTIGGALVVPTAAASLDMAVEFVIEAFAVVVIGGLGSMAGALAGSLLVVLIRAGSLVVYPEFEVLAIYLIVVGVLLFKPSGLFGKPAV